MKVYLKRIKQSLFWFYFLKFFIKNLYYVFWRFILNFHGSILYFLWFLKKRTYYDLKGKNYLILKNDPELKEFSKRISKKIPNEILEKIKTDMINGNIKTSNESNSFEKTYTTDIFFEIDEKTREEIVDFALSEKMISTASRHMKIFPIISRIILNYNIVNTNEQRGAMLWHRDAFGYKSLDVFLALSDINKDSGPLSILTKESRLGIFTRNINEKNFARPGERGKIDDEKVNSENNVENNIGDKGTTVLIDSYVSYHKGGNCKDRERLMLRISYQGVDAIDFRKQENEFLFNRKLKKNEINSKFKKYALFKRTKILNLFNFKYHLIKFYRMMQYLENS